ncbi:MAG: N-formylglutamate amidohydrolase [Pseudomonadota bacterium]
MGESPQGAGRRGGRPNSAVRSRSAVSPFAGEEAGAREQPYSLRRPDRLSSGVVFSSPHSGRAYFSDFIGASRLDLRRLRASEDAYVDRLFATAADFGAPVLSAVAPRAFVDLNRCPDDLDPSLLDGAAKRPANARVAAGLGVVPRIVAEGVSIYDGKLSLEEAKARIRHWHAPYHARLAQLLSVARRRFGEALLIDCHSMPSGAVALSHRRGSPVDVVLGDRFGASASKHHINAIEAAFADAGFRVERNAPFAGGYITERFGRPQSGVSAIQIEIDRGLYLDQSRVAPSVEFDRFIASLRPVIRQICALVVEVSAGYEPPPLAAE